ncbi:biosynthetic-type acetolactate synthase large subunit [Lentisphaera marina]|uniref:biosynthetic-type acetolactate synthase large subunit n=1 Tax=Lentisphaera marina TaxID=1111041 RepID=UPI0023666A2C|nr:biosynthetic-type acetolactate synthase large subunit [Lentisphaera marina]MDD7986811.1 biosynthetic-type acetolactate synthase large subunit [Lentisphaera marina]
MNAAEAVIKCLEKHGVEYIFGYSGGAAIPFFDALVTTNTDIELILVRHEQGATHMADGYARATGKPGVVLVTSGPGATNTITGLITAQMDSVPMIVITGQTISPMLGKDAFQEADVFGISLPVVKHSYLVRSHEDITRTVNEAFYVATSGRPGPVVIDVPKDISSTEGVFDLDAAMDLPGYTVPGHGDKDKIKQIAKAFKKARKPLLLVGHGCVLSSAEEEVRELAEKLNVPVVTTLLGKGAISEKHDLSLGMLGMHGTAYANFAVKNCDLVCSIGSRWDDRIVGKLDEFCADAVRIHIDIDPSEYGKMITPDYWCVGDARLILEELILQVEECDSATWVEEVKQWRQDYPLKYDKIQGGLTMQEVLAELDKQSDSEAIVATDVGQHQMWAAQFCKSTKGKNWLSSGGAGTMGFGFPAAIGAQFGRPDDLVVSVSGDGGFQMTLFELSTAAIHKLPVKILVLNNSYLGMVRQWQELFFDERLSGVDMVGNPDFVKLAESYGVKAFRMSSSDDVAKVWEEALAYNDGPCLIEAVCNKTDNVYPMIPAGANYDKMLLEAPSEKLDKPTGST